MIDAGLVAQAPPAPTNHPAAAQAAYTAAPAMPVPLQMPTWPGARPRMDSDVHTNSLHGLLCVWPGRVVLREVAE